MKQGPSELGRLRDSLRTHEIEMILDALERTEGNQVRAAEYLGIPLRTLVYKLRKLDIRQHQQRRRAATVAAT